MKPNKSQVWAMGIVNLGASILMGCWLGSIAGVTAFVVGYLIFGLIHSDYYENVGVWTWFFDLMRKN